MRSTIWFEGLEFCFVPPDKAYASLHDQDLLMNDSFRPYRTGSGQQRGVAKSEEDVRLKEKAKVHHQKQNNKQVENPDEFLIRKDRGHQKGFGKN